jgi:prepilin-type N-terminal cleavage/methylation domain-containing protein
MPLAPGPHAVRSVRRSPRQGFTLLELMVVVAIIGVTAAIAAPTINRAIASSRADRATHDIVRLGRRARSEAVAFGRAYLLRMSTLGDGGVELWRGRTSLCRQDWSVITSTGTCSPTAAPDGNCVDYSYPSMYAAPPWTLRISQQALPVADLCFTPNGEMVTRPSGSSGAFGSPALGAVTITVALSSAEGADPLRGAVFPVAGAPRTLR